MQLTIINRTGRDIIDTADFASANWYDVYHYCQAILSMNGTAAKFEPPKGSDDWSGERWLLYCYGL